MNNDNQLHSWAVEGGLIEVRRRYINTQNNHFQDDNYYYDNEEKKRRMKRRPAVENFLLCFGRNVSIPNTVDKAIWTTVDMNADDFNRLMTSRSYPTSSMGVLMEERLISMMNSTGKMKYLHSAITTVRTRVEYVVACQDWKEVDICCCWVRYINIF
jgi:hypothetical protein